MKTPALLSAHDWKFSSLRDDEVIPCHDWEFSRAATLEKNPCFVNDPGQWEDGSGLLADAPHPPPWPHQAFQALPQETRKELSSHWTKTPAIWGVSLNEILDWVDPASGETACATDSGNVVAAFEFNPRRSHKAIVEGFSRWLEEYLEHNPAETEETRGRDALQSQCKIELEALGILRILKHHAGMTVEQIIPLYEDSLPKRFSDPAAWSRAKSRAFSCLRG